MKKKMSKKLKIFLSILGVILTFFIVVNICPGKKVMDNNPFIATKEQKVMIAAHRGGAEVNPENTFLAFDNAINDYKVDILELDLCMTLDGYLVANHNLDINDVSDVQIDNYLISEHTLSELSYFNFGYNFKDLNGNYPYRNILIDNNVSEENRVSFLKENKLTVATINEIFDKYDDLGIKFILEIKDGGELGKKAADELYKQMKTYNMFEKVIIGSFDPEIEGYIKDNYPNLYRGGSVATSAVFIATEILKVNPLASMSITALQIPMEFDITDNFSLKLDKKAYIRRAHRRNISVQFWTIDNVNDMRHLIELGVDVIMTDRPDLLYTLLKDEYNCR